MQGGRVIGPFDVERTLASINAAWLSAHPEVVRAREAACAAEGIAIPAFLRKDYEARQAMHFIMAANPILVEALVSAINNMARDEESHEPSLAMRLLGREIHSDTKRYDERELERAYNQRNED